MISWKKLRLKLHFFKELLNRQMSLDRPLQLVAIILKAPIIFLSQFLISANLRSFQIYILLEAVPYIRANIYGMNYSHLKSTHLYSTIRDNISNFMMGIRKLGLGFCLNLYIFIRLSNQKKNYLQILPAKFVLLLKKILC